MAPRGETPAGQHRRLIVALRQAREACGMTQKEVADALEWSASKLIRIEKGAVGISVTDLKALLLHYGVTDNDEVGQLVEQARASKKAVWWQQYRSVMPTDFLTFLELEASAIRVKQFQGLVVPGMLQSPSYIKALLGINVATPEAEQRGLEIRLKRQELISDAGPEFFFIIDESTLYRTVGGGVAMREQLMKLRELSGHPRVSIRILPFTAGARSGMLSSYEILELSDEPDDYVLWVDQAYKAQLLQVPNDETRAFFALFEELEEIALPGDETPHVLEARLKEIEKDG